MSQYHVNPATGNPGRCSARHRCPFGGDEAHHANEADARAAYEAGKSSFAPQVKLQAVETPKDSYLSPDAAREMWARGAKVERHSMPPNFDGVKLGTSKGFMAGSLYQDGGWKPASFTPDGNLAFVDVNRFYSSREELAIFRWDREKQEWTKLYRPMGGAAGDISGILSEYGYKRTSTGMIAARDVRKLEKALSQEGAERPSSGEVDPSFSNSIRPPKLVKTLSSSESRERAEAIMYHLESFPDDLEGSVPDTSPYREAAEGFLSDAQEYGSPSLSQMKEIAMDWSKSDDSAESMIGFHVLEEIKREESR